MYPVPQPASSTRSTGRPLSRGSSMPKRISRIPRYHQNSRSDRAILANSSGFIIKLRGNHSKKRRGRVSGGCSSPQVIQNKYINLSVNPPCLPFAVLYETEPWVLLELEPISPIE